MHGADPNVSIPQDSNVRTKQSTMKIIGDAFRGQFSRKSADIRRMLIARGAKLDPFAVPKTPRIPRFLASEAAWLMHVDPELRPLISEPTISAQPTIFESLFCYIRRRRRPAVFRY
jgi:hypothetical protein